MTTGEKITKLRKEREYTQEEFANLLGVSRQSISKWESDSAFPETSKLIEIAKLFNVSIDYLLVEDGKNESVINEDDTKSENDGNPNNTNNINQYFTKDYLLSNKAYTTYYSLGVFILTLLFFLLPTLSVTYSNVFGTYNVDANFYNIVFADNYKIGNYITLVVFLITFANLGVALGIYFTGNKKLYLVRKIISIIQVVLLVIFIMLFFNDTSVGIFFISLFELVNVILLFTIKFNKD